MNKTTQHAVIIDNISSPYIEQAIIILKDFSHNNREKVIADAEKIVRDYLEKIKTDDSDITIYNRPSSKEQKDNSKSVLKNPMLYICLALTAVVGCLLFFRI